MLDREMLNKCIRGAKDKSGTVFVIVLTLVTVM
jgi:hypothetical protein